MNSHTQDGFDHSQVRSFQILGVAMKLGAIPHSSCQHSKTVAQWFEESPPLCWDQVSPEPRLPHPLEILGQNLAASLGMAAHDGDTSTQEAEQKG